MRSMVWAAAALLFGALVSAPGEASAQEARRLTVGVSAGGAGVQTGGTSRSWEFGPVLGGRLEWGTRRSAAGLGVDLQPFWASGSATVEEFRALYVLPSYVIGSGGRRIRLGAGLGFFDLTESEEAGGFASEGVEVGFVAGASGSLRLHPSYAVELGWKRIQNVKNLRANVWTLQLVRSWRR